MGPVCTFSVLLLVSAAFGASESEYHAKSRELSQQMEAIRRERRDPLREKIEQRRRTLRDQVDLKDLHAAIANAQQVYDALVANDEAIRAARKAAEAAEKALPEITRLRLAQDPNISAMQAEYDEARKREESLQKEEQDLRRQFDRLRSKLRESSPDIKAAREAYQQAEKAYYDLPKTHPRFVAARQAVEDAQKALNERIKTLPEKRALDAAQEFYAELRQKDPAVLQARQARDAARKYYEDMTDHVLRTDPNGAAIQQRLDEIDEEDELAEAQQFGLREALNRARQEAEKTDPEILAARKEYEQARSAHHQVLAKRAGAEARILADAKSTLERRLGKKAALDPILLDLQDKLKKAEEEMEALNRRRQELYRAYHEKRRRERE